VPDCNYSVPGTRAYSIYLLRPRKRWRSVEMSMSVCVCLSVCVSVRQDISGTTHAIFTKFSVHVAYGRGSDLLRQCNEIQRKGAVLGVFFANDSAIVKRSLQITSFSSRRDHSVAAGDDRSAQAARAKCDLCLPC